MRKLALTLLLAAASMAMPAAPARACDPYWDWEWCFGWYEPEPAAYEIAWSEPAYEPYPEVWLADWWGSTSDLSAIVAYEYPIVIPNIVEAPAPIVPSAPEPAPAPAPPPPAYVPAPEPEPVWTAPIVDVLPAWDPPPPPPAAVPAPEPAPVPREPDVIAADLGLHRVTEVWAGDVVVTRGPVTTYTTNTVSQDAGTYATLVASVGTGEASGYDALLSNPRTTLTDGRPVMGDIYANYVWDGSAIVLDQYVFFQDDLEVARVLASPMPPTPTAPVDATPPTPRADPTAAIVPQPSAADPAPTMPSPSPVPITPRLVRAGVALAPEGDVLDRIEVLRGRRVDLWPRATADGVPARVTSWSLLSGEATVLSAVSAAGDVPLMAMWEHLAPLGSSFVLRFAIVVDVPGEPARSAEAVISILVRSPGLVE